MKTVIQRVTRACVRVDEEIVGTVDRGLMILLGVEQGDSNKDVDALVNKIIGLRVFPGRTPMDLNVSDVQGGCLVVSQFTLCGRVNKGRRPSYHESEEPSKAEDLYELFKDKLAATGIPVQGGKFGASMQVELVNEGPVTLCVNTKEGCIL